MEKIKKIFVVFILFFFIIFIYSEETSEIKDVNEIFVIKTFIDNTSDKIENISIKNYMEKYENPFFKETEYNYLFQDINTGSILEKKLKKQNKNINNVYGKDENRENISKYNFRYFCNYINYQSEINFDDIIHNGEIRNSFLVNNKIIDKNIKVEQSIGKINNLFLLSEEIYYYLNNGIINILLKNNHNKLLTNFNYSYINKNKYNFQNGVIFETNFSDLHSIELINKNYIYNNYIFNKLYIDSKLKFDFYNFYYFRNSNIYFSIESYFNNKDNINYILNFELNYYIKNFRFVFGNKNNDDNLFFKKWLSLFNFSYINSLILSLSSGVTAEENPFQLKTIFNSYKEIPEIYSKIGCGYENKNFAILFNFSTKYNFVNELYFFNFSFDFYRIKVRNITIDFYNNIIFNSIFSILEYNNTFSIQFLLENIGILRFENFFTLQNINNINNKIKLEFSIYTLNRKGFFYDK